MNLLTNENIVVDTSELSEYTDPRYCVLDYSNRNDVDFHFIPVMVLEEFNRPATLMSIGEYTIKIPLDWAIVIADKECGIMETIELRHINDREFDAFVFNPISSYRAEFKEMVMENIYPDVLWSIPKLKKGHILVVPLHDGPDAPCIFLIKDFKKIPEELNLADIL